MILDNLPLDEDIKKIVLYRFLQHLKTYHDNGDREYDYFDDGGECDGWDECLEEIEKDVREELSLLGKKEVK